MKRIGTPTWAGLVLLGFSGQLAWAVENQFFNTFLYDKITPDPRPISWMVSVTAVVALLTTLLMGTLSDRTRSRWGRRRPYMLAGYVLWGLFTAAFPFAAYFQPVALGVAMAILFDSLMSFCGSTANDAAFNAWVTDVTTPDNRGRTLGVLEILKWVALLITYGGAGLAVTAFGYFTFFYLIAGVVIAMGLVGGLLAKEPPLPAEPPREGFLRQIAGNFRWEALRKHRTLLLILVSVMLWNTAFNVFFPYLMIYLQHFLKVDTLSSALVVGVSILVGGIGMGYPLGILADRWGRRPVALLAVALEFAGLFLFSFARSLPALVLTGICWIMPMAAWSIATSAWEKDLFPEEGRAQFQGWEILFRVTLTMIPGPLLGGWIASRWGTPTVLDGKAGFIPTPLLFQVSAFATLLAAVPLFAARENRPAAADRR